MIVRVPDLTSEVRALDFSESAAGLNAILSANPGWAEQRFESDVSVQGEIYKQGSDVYFNGTVAGNVTCTCPRCVDEFTWPMRRDFNFLIVKADPGQDFEDDAGLDHYDSDDLDLGRLAREQALLALDESVLCSEACRGLCSGCGANLNREACTCRRVQ
jgi:uncharacterized protein